MRKPWGHHVPPAAESVVLSPGQLLERLPDTTLQSVEQWPFDDVALDPNPQAWPGQFRQADDGLVRVTGLVLPFRDISPDERTIGLRVNTAQALTSVILDVNRALPYAQLRGLFMDVALEYDEGGDPDSLVRLATLRQVHGVERPLRAGDARGILRGQVQTINQSEFGPESYGMTALSGNGMFDVHWNPSRSPTLDRDGLLKIGNIVVLGVEKRGDSANYMWHPNIEDSRHYLVEAAPDGLAEA